MPYLISTGKSPDYVMRRGRELLNYTCHIHFIGNDDKEYTQCISDRSLFVVAREASQIAVSRLGAGFQCKEPVFIENRTEINLLDLTEHRSLLLRWIIPQGLPDQLKGLISNELIAFIKNFSESPR